MCNVLLDLDMHSTRGIKNLLKTHAPTLVSFMPNVLLGFIEPMIKSDYKRPLFAKSSFVREFELDLAGIECVFLSGPSDDYYTDLGVMFQPASSAYLNKWIEISGRSDTSIDVGSYTGLFSVLGALSGANVFAFEPNRYPYERMKANIERNQLKDLVTLNPVALGDTMSFSRTLIPRNQLYSSGLQLELSPTERDLSEWVLSDPVNVSTLDFELRHLNSSVGALKIDAEGFELEILQGGKNLLIDHKPTIFLECLSPDRLEQCISYIISIGIQIHNIDYVDKEHNNYILYLI